MRLLVFGMVIGLAIGIAGTILGPQLAGPYLPPAMKSGVSVEGTVVAKQREPDRLLLTVRAEEGSTLVTFTKKVPEIDLLVEETDTIVLALRHYQPFIKDPEILRVEKEPSSPNSRDTPPRPNP